MVRTAPDGIDERELSAALEDHWGLAPAWLGYLPVGFGDHHWELTDSADRRWFVTVAGLTGAGRDPGPAAGYADLRAAMDTVTALAAAGLEFAVAPVPTTGGQALARLGDAHAITVFPYLEGAGASPRRGAGPGLCRPERSAVAAVQLPPDLERCPDQGGSTRDALPRPEARWRDARRRDRRKPQGADG